MDLPSSLEWGVHVPILLGLAQVLKTSSSKLFRCAKLIAPSSSYLYTFDAQ